MRNLEKFAQIVASTCGVRVAFDCERGVAPHASLQTSTIHLPQRKNLWLEDEEALIANTLHEAAHICYTDLIPNEKYEEIFKMIGDKYNPDDLFSCMNAIEDMRVNALMSERFPGAQELFREDYKRVADTFWGIESFAARLSRADQFLWLVSDLISYNGYLYKDYVSEGIDIEIAQDVREINANSGGIFQARTTTDLIMNYLIPVVYPLYLKYLMEIDPKDKKMMDMIKQLVQAMGEAIKGMMAGGEGAKIKEEKKARGEGQQKTQSITAKMSDADKRRLMDDVKKKMEGKRGGLGVGGQNGRKVIRLDDTLAGKMRKVVDIMKEKAYLRIQKGLKRGKICGSQLYKVSTNTSSVFQKKQNQDMSGDIAVSLLVDCSGSMHGDQLEIAGECSYIIAKALERANKPCIINAFDDGLHPIKKTREKMTNEMFYRMVQVDGGGTNEASAVTEAIKELEELKQGKKLLIVINDGSPNDGDKLRAAIKKRDASTNVVGIGIYSESVRNYYDNHVVLQDVSKLPDELFKIIKKMVGRRG